MARAYYNRTTSKVLPTPLHDAYKYAKISRKPDIYMCTRTSQSSYLLASFPGSPRARTKNRRKGEATENWAGPGNEAKILLCASK